ncbi:MAG: hypothetical protein KDM64_17535, partial [Verrucomicrobiae bacterium]|nr:hypothetical protein [Verrucomicrobiae bacterium]
MSKETKIQWCDSTVNPIMGCAGCELFPSAGEVLQAIDEAVAGALGAGGEAMWRTGSAKHRFRSLIFAAYDRIEEGDRHAGHRRAVTTTNLWHLRDQFVQSVKEERGPVAATAAQSTMDRAITCYAAKLHLNKGLSLVNPTRKTNSGYAPVFEQLTRYPNRVREAAGWADLLGRTDPDRPWINGLPRLIFLSDMGDALSRESDFPFLQETVIEPIAGAAGRRHLWLWLTKRPERMARLSEQLD